MSFWTLFVPRARSTRTLLACGSLAGLMSLTGVARAADATAALRKEMDAAIAKVKPALVRIRVVSTDFRDGREVKMQSVGSGSIISKDGYIITNHHVAGHGERIFCTFSDREEVEAELIGTDPLTDIAIIKLKPAKPRVFPTVTFGDSTKLRAGDYVLALGSPMALSQSVTLGIISNTEMVLPRFFGPGGAMQLDGENVGALVRWIAHDAAIYGGNSGGPLVNLKGEIIGINEISYGLSGAIPGNLARQVADELIATGKITRSWLGFNAQPLFKHSDGGRGVLISGVYKDSPAARAGMQSGDRLLRLNGQPTDARFDEQMPAFMQLVTSLTIGKPVEAVVERDGKELKVRITPMDRGERFPKESELRQWGMTVRNLSFLMAIEIKRDSLDGIVVTSVRPGGPVGEAKPAMSAGDILIEVNSRPVKSVKELIAVTEQLTEGKSEPLPVVATFERRAARYMTIVKVGNRDLKDPGLEVTKAWLPVETQVISRDIANQLGQPSLKGFYLTRIYPGTTAEKAGLKAGDFLIAVDGEKLTASAPEHEDELTTLIRQYDIGKTIELLIFRDGKEQKVAVELERSPRLRREMKKYRNDDFEFTARDVCFFDIAEEKWDRGQRGALVEEVKSGSWAELGSLGTGDLIVEVDGQPITSVETLRPVMEQIAAGRKSVIVMKVQRGIHTAYLELEPDWKN